jgi:zinc transporter 2
VRAAMAHVIGDILQSVGVCIAAALIWAFHDRWLDENGISYWYRADPICTFLFSVLVMWSTMGTVNEAVHVLMAGVPYSVDPEDLTAHLRSIRGVLGVHDLHVWTLAGEKINVWAHLTVESGCDSTRILYAAQGAARSIGCHHSCFQLEDAGAYDVRVEGEGCFEPSSAAALHSV